ncbi:MAG: ACT domain-containing protein [Methanobacteriota archaeon]|nr:MAG: ACT domain-containing protein [Euryarchaeota archaeon]
MRIGLDIELKDTPGQLVRALEPVSRLGGNIISIVHIREELTKKGRVPVHLTIDIENDGALERIIKELGERDIWVSKVGEVKKKERMKVILIGHVVDTDLRDTIDRLNEIPGILVADMALSMPNPQQETSALMDIEVSRPEKAKKAISELERIARDKGLAVIKSLGV